MPLECQGRPPVWRVGPPVLPSFFFLRFFLLVTRFSRCYLAVSVFLVLVSRLFCQFIGIIGSIAECTLFFFRRRCYFCTGFLRGFVFTEFLSGFIGSLDFALTTFATCWFYAISVLSFYPCGQRFGLCRFFFGVFRGFLERSSGRPMASLRLALASFAGVANKSAAKTR